MFRGAALTLVVMLCACAGHSSEPGSGGGAGLAGVSTAGSSGDLAMAGNAAMAGSSPSGGNQMAGGSAATQGGASSNDAGGGASPAGSSAGGAGNEAGASGEAGGSGLECPSGCSPSPSAVPCQGGVVTWVCAGPGPFDYDALLDGGCTDLFTQVPRFCCPLSFRPECS
jgi:hypothetical protein